MSEGVDGVEAGGAASGHESEEDADGCREGKGDDVDFWIEQEGGSDHAGQRIAQAVGEGDAGHAADAGEGDCLDEKLEQYFAGPRSDGEADPDLAGSFGDGDEHDIHDADASDEQADPCDRAQ